jgi:penicillin G amidase
LESAIKSGQPTYGNDLAKWTYGSELQWFFAHPIGSHLPLVNRFFDLGPVAMSGAGTTVKQTSSRLGPSMRMVIDWSDLDRSEQNIAVGESEHVTSGHYKDQWPAYYAGKSFPMQFSHVEAEQVLTIFPQ